MTQTVESRGVAERLEALRLAVRAGITRAKVCRKYAPRAPFTSAELAAIGALMHIEQGLGRLLEELADDGGSEARRTPT